MRVALIAAAGILAAGAAVLYARRRTEKETEADTLGAEFEIYFNVATQEAAELFDNITGGTMKISSMSKVTPAQIAHPNVQAFLRVIRRGEGTADANGYRRIFGGQLFDSFADHPRIKVTKSGYTSTAAGAFQFLASTWDETKRVMGLPDFTPASQERGAVGRIAARGALDDVIAGRFAQAVNKCGREWASLPGSPYGQPVISMLTASNVYTQFGGTVSA